MRYDPMPDQDTTNNVPLRDKPFSQATGDAADLLTLLNFGRDIPPLYSPAFGKRLAEVIDQVTRLSPARQ
jgi:hypothetical protein